MRLSPAFPAFALALAACGSQGDTGETPPDSAETMMPVEPDGGIGDGAEPPPAMVSAAAAEGIPVRFHGVWDHVEGTCGRASDLRVEISAYEVLFYEAYGAVQSSVEAEGGTEVTLAMEGEGESWESRFLLALQDDPERLVISNTEFPNDPTNIRKRCPS